MVYSSCSTNSSHRYMQQTNSSSSQNGVTSSKNNTRPAGLKFLTPLPHHNLSLNTIKQISPHHYVLSPNPDPAKKPARLWFHFQVNCYESNSYSLTIEGITKRRLSWNGCFVRRCGTCESSRIEKPPSKNGKHEHLKIENTTGEGKWKRVVGTGTLSTPHAATNRGGIPRAHASSQNRCAIEISLKLKQNFCYEIAYFQPYTVQYMRSRLKRWHQLFPDRCKVEKVTDSFEGRPVNLVTVCTGVRGGLKPKNNDENSSSPGSGRNGSNSFSSKTNCKTDPKKTSGPKPTICITGRVHSGEVPSSWIVDGFLEFIIESNSEVAQRLRNECCFRVVPLLNVDGVAHGHYRSNALGEDMNRLWLNPSAELHPEIFNLRKLLLSWKDSDKYSLDFFIDVHAHSNGVSSFMYYNFVSDMGQRSELLQLPKLISSRSNGMFSYKMCAVDSSMRKIGCARRALGEIMQIFPFAFTLETSFVGYPPGGNGRAALVPFHTQQLKMIGSHLAHSFDEYYQTSKSKVLDRFHGRGIQGQMRKKSYTASSSPVSKDEYLWNEFVMGSNKDLLRASSSADDLVGIRRKKAMPTISRLARLSSKNSQSGPNSNPMMNGQESINRIIRLYP
mmetsp:Transcript_9588/g.35530  ORF Transcript_9588/g.35530 Transcript_9588/m.35530 type:complete len:616 (+) Transcript_9588:118-1965(+)|eukprot:CAMPEP_0117443570 /NCGR_PEP_ID=MMETSP0759-20121206/4762_1 /TAXON_ID=63605 /ORGANISM="Percolomonas cosmopolitus, Strain WS" /LENGTH=615 /DNA_ID=CAMNT_0005235547 /DNA_START=100 /DNA_END=1947 /DNA_ORIENTATION=-